MPSPQPNGRTKRLRECVQYPLTPARESASPELGYGPNTSTGSANPGWEAAASTSSQPWSVSRLDEGDGPTDRDTQGEFSDSTLDAFLASLGSETENGQGWAWPLFGDSALELTLGPPGSSASNPSTTPIPPPDLSPTSAMEYVQQNSHHHQQHQQTSFMPNKMVSAAAVLDHLPALSDYWVGSFSHVLNVLGPGHNPQVNNMLPVVQRSPLVMCALIAWAATHRANVGHPYGDVARLATDTTEVQADQLNIDRELTPDESEEYMWTLLILGGVEIVNGDVKGWVRRLPMTRRLLSKVIDTLDFKADLTWQALAYSCAYHDILASVTTTSSPDFPIQLYNRILSAGGLEMDSYMAATRRVFQFLVEIAVLAGKVSSVYDQLPSPGRDRALCLLLSEAEGILMRIRTVDLPSGLFSHSLPNGTDRSLLIVAFHTYQLAAELYLRQAVHRSAPSDIQCSQLASRIMVNMRLLLDSPNESQMCFPLFLAGVATRHDSERAEIVSIFNKFSERVQVRNVIAVAQLLLDVWKIDVHGDRYVDWRKMAEENDVALSFA